MAKTTAKSGKTHSKVYSGRRARKAPACPVCGRRLRRTTKRHGQGSHKRRSAWTPNADRCQFHA